MAQFRKINPAFWTDSVIQSITPDQRYLYLYLITNAHSEITGLYKITEKTIAFETDLQPDQLALDLRVLEVEGKIVYDGTTMFVLNMLTHHANRSPKFVTMVKTQIDLINDCNPKRAFLAKYGDWIGVPGPSPSETGLKELQEATKDQPAVDYTSLPGTAQYAERIYREVTGHIAVPSYNRMSALDNINAISRHFDHDEEKIKDLLSETFAKWKGSKGKDGNRYSQNNTGWLDWALTGTVATQPEAQLNSKYKPV